MSMSNKMSSNNSIVKDTKNNNSSCDNSKVQQEV